MCAQWELNFPANAGKAFVRAPGGLGAKKRNTILSDAHLPPLAIVREPAPACVTPALRPKHLPRIALSKHRPYHVRLRPLAVPNQ
jgi:hypothetical protein